VAAWQVARLFFVSIPSVLLALRFSQLVAASFSSPVFGARILSAASSLLVVGSSLSFGAFFSAHRSDYSSREQSAQFLIPFLSPDFAACLISSVSDSALAIGNVIIHRIKGSSFSNFY
jgi:hypothetical protein